MTPALKKIAIPVAHFHGGNTAEYLLLALRKMGHQAEIIEGTKLAESLKIGRFDLFICVDSGEPLDLTAEDLRGISFERLGFWFIDFRHNKNRSSRYPDDWTNARIIGERGGWIFQSQYEDWLECRDAGLRQCTWIPLGADPQIWSDRPPENKCFHLAFAGNVWDEARARVLQGLAQSPGIKFGFRGHGAAWKEDAARLLRKSLAGFNINSYYGEPYAYDINMRVFETLSCGVPLITNSVPSLPLIFGNNPPFIREYRTIEELPAVLKSAFNDQDFLNSGNAAREFIEKQANYSTRAEQMLAVFTQ